MEGSAVSAPLKVAESGHIQRIMSGLNDPNLRAQLPESISFDQTVLSTFNLSLFVILLILVPMLLFFIAKKRPLPLQPIYQYIALMFPLKKTLEVQKN